MGAKSAQIAPGMRFIGGIVFTAVALLFLGFPFVMGLAQHLTAVLAGILLSLVGVSNHVVGGVLPSIVMEHWVVGIIPLCVGDLELAILVGAILFTEDRTVAERVKGALQAGLFVLLVNPVRIAVTLWIGSSYGLAAMELFHSLLFRLTLIIVIVLFYVWWYVGRQ